MIRKMLKKSTAVFVAISVLAALSMTSCAKKGTQETDTKVDPTQAVTATKAPEADKEAVTDTPAAAEPKIIRFGTHWQAGLDPNYKDPTTGEYTMEEASRQASLAALQAVKDQLNVEVEFIQYATDTRSELITSVLANNPVCDIAILWGGSENTVLSQNILQPLDDYADMFADEEYSWMLYDKLYGHNYFLTSKQAFVPRWPLIYNATMIEKVDSLKDENGKTIYPTTLFLEGKWTWNTFKDYISKIKTYYANTKAPDSAEYDMVQAYETDHRFAGLSAIFAAGGGIYGADGIQADSAASLKATSFIKELMDAGVMVDCGLYDDGYTPKWCQGASDFQAGASVFTDCPDWLIGGTASAASDRGESIGIVPWPRPDDMAADDPAYRQVLTVGDSMGILKGVDEETTKLALEFLKVYYSTYYKTLGSVDSLSAYKDSAATAQAASFGFDIFSEQFGDDLLSTFQYVANQTVPNDYSDLLGFRVIWDDIFGKSLYGVDGYASYDVSVAANKSLFTEKASGMEAILSSDEIRDNIAPEIKNTDPVVLAAGTDPAGVAFSDYVSVTDAIDGVLDATAASYDYSAADFNTVGKYDNGLKVKMADKSGNEASMSTSVVIYNPDNKSAPVITLVETPRAVRIDEDASAISWKGDFIASAVDADGLDVSGKLAADISSLDTSTPGDYEVVITVTDYAGNSSNVTLTVTVAKAE